MQAILTKVIPATNTKPTRINASCGRGSKTVSADAAGPTEHAGSQSLHAKVARILCNEFVMEDQGRYGSHKNPWSAPFVTGQLPNGDYCHVFLEGGAK